MSDFNEDSILNHDEYRKAPKFIDKPEVGAHFQIFKAGPKAIDDYGRKYIDIWVRLEKGGQRGRVMKERFLLTGPADGKQGSAWKFRLLAISIGFYKTVEGEDIVTGFNCIDMINKRFQADVKFPVREGYDKTYATLSKITDIMMEDAGDHQTEDQINAMENPSEYATGEDVMREDCGETPF